MTLDTLYKRTKTGEIQYWEVSSIPQTDGTCTIFKKAGRLGTTKPTTHFENIREGKNIGRSNETTPAQQGELQARSDWNKKRDEGYKSVADLGLKPIDMTIYKNVQQPLYHVPGTPADTGKPLELALDAALSQFNTDAQGNVKPMLAKDWNKGKGIKFPQLQEKKLDGVRTLCIVQNNAASITVQFLSRSGKPYDTIFHLTNFLGTKPDVFPMGTTILDGELYFHGWTLEEINQAVKKHRPGITEKIEFWFFDLPLLTELPQQARTEKVHELAHKLDPHQTLIKPTESRIVMSVAEATENHDAWVLDGFEGAMLKEPNAKYEQGCRSSNWRKMKEFDDTEFEIIGYELGQRGSEDLMLQIQSGPEIVPVKMQGTRETKAALYERAKSGELIGKQLTVKHFGLSKYGVVNLPTGKAIREE
jgi:ATP-dependent DNA ligase